MKFKNEYPQIVSSLQFFTIESNLDLEQIQGIVYRDLSTNHDLVSEICRIFDDKLIIWRDIMNCDEIGEVYDTDSEEDAREYARLIFWVPLEKYERNNQ